MESASEPPANDLTAQQHRAIISLLQCNAHKDAAAQAEIDERTLRRWLALPHFRKAYRAALNEFATEGIAQAMKTTSEAVAALRANLKASGNVSNRAAQILLEVVLRSTDKFEVLDRLDALEAKEAAKANAPSPQLDNEQELIDEPEADEPSEPDET